jgi:hypothetical protein
MARLTLVFVVALTLLLVPARDAGANMAKSWHEGEGHGPLVPRNDVDIGVDSEELVFDVAPSLDHAAVTATYRMTHAGTSPTTAEVAFVVVDAETPSPRPIEAKIAIDGAPVSHHVLDVEDVLEPMLDTWLDANADASSELARFVKLDSPRYEDWTRLSRVVPGCQGECYGLVAWYRLRKETLGKGEVLPAARIALPGEVAKLYAGWSKLGSERPIHWLLFEIPFAAGASRTVTVAYEHSAGSNARTGPNDVFLYDYALSPASRWARFGALHLTVRAPPNTRVGSSVPLSPTGDTYRADLATLPSGELSLDLMSLAGVPFGVTHPAAYWAVLLALMLAITLAVGRALGRRFATAASRGRRIAWSIVVTGPAVLLANVVLAALASAALPRHAFGYGYDPVLGFFVAIVFFTVTGLAASFIRAEKRG